jgi:hypothetical protein
MQLYSGLCLHPWRFLAAITENFAETTCYGLSVSPNSWVRNLTPKFMLMIFEGMWEEIRVR